MCSVDVDGINNFKYILSGFRNDSIQRPLKCFGYLRSYRLS